MGLPSGSTKATGSMSVKNPAGKGQFGAWIVSLRCTYTVAKTFTRRNAWWAFVTMWAFRMAESRHANIDLLKDNGPPPPPRKPKAIIDIIAGNVNNPFPLFGAANAIAGIGIENWKQALDDEKRKDQQVKGPIKKAIPYTFSFDEGLYMDSKSITFEASWLLATRINEILLATGLFQQPPSVRDRNIWAVDMKNIMGARSWLVNAVDVKGEAIIDLGGGV